jgi:outer membrane protein TolC
MIGLVFAAGCAQSQSNLQDRLAQRVQPVEIVSSKATTGDSEKIPAQKTGDAAVRPASASQVGQGDQVRSENDRSVLLPPALEGSAPRAESDRTPSFALPLPRDSDEAALQAIVAAGKPVTLPEAIDLAFRLQPRLRAELETIEQARGRQQIAFSAFLPMAGVRFDGGGFQLGAGGLPLPTPTSGVPANTFIPGIGSILVGTHLQTSFDLIEGNVQWLLLDFGRRLGRYEQARLAGDVAGLQTDRAFQTVANEVSVAYYNVLRTQALLKTAQDALRRAEEELEDTRKREREGIVEREIVLRSEVQRAEFRQQLHAATEAVFVALAGLNLAIGMKCNEPLNVLDPLSLPPLAPCLADCLQTAIRERSEFEVVRHTVQIATAGSRVARADFAPRATANGALLNFQGGTRNLNADLALGFIRLEWTLFEGGRRIAATRVADSAVRQAMAQAESIADQIAFQVNEAYRNAVTAWVGIDDARPAVDQATENYRLVRLRLREGAATPTEIADAQASLTRAQQNYQNARYSYLIAMAKLDYAMGVGLTPMTQTAAYH